MENIKKNIVVSAINLTEAGPLTVLEECLQSLSADFSDAYNIIALVHKKNVLKANENIIFYEFPAAKKSWILRIYYEYFYFRYFSKKMNPYLWLSLHDITPNVYAQKLAVYCHNPSPFYKLSFSEAVLDPKFALFNSFYQWLYRINLKKNNYVIVQQEWIRERFKKIFGVNNIIVAYPSVSASAEMPGIIPEKIGKKTFFYPAFPRVFKNFDVICEAASILVNKGIDDFFVYLTIDGTENSYARSLVRKFGHIKQLKFLGRLSREKVGEYYKNTDCLIFPSKLETWGMPITEFKKYSKPIMLSDLEYAHETLGDYEKAKFFDPYDPNELSRLMNEFMKNTLVFDKVEGKNIEPPFAANWRELFNLLL